jgi:hypothetical protein
LLLRLQGETSRLSRTAQRSDDERGRRSFLWNFARGISLLAKLLES